MTPAQTGAGQDPRRAPPNGGQNRHTPEGGQNRHPPDGGQNRHPPDGGQNRHPPQGGQARTTPRDARRRTLSWLAAGALLGLTAWAGGLLWFIQDARSPAPPPGLADGIVALTGGQDRIATGLALLRQGRAGRLLISGVGPQFDLDALLRATGGDTTGLAARITLGRSATDTLGNAAETAAWARENRLDSLIVVTAGYHMRRALIELSRAMPDLRLQPAKVVPPVLRSPPGPRQLRVLATEYTKYLAALLGLNRLPRPDARANGHADARANAHADARADAPADIPASLAKPPETAPITAPTTAPTRAPA